MTKFLYEYILKFNMFNAKIAGEGDTEVHVTFNARKLSICLIHSWLYVQAMYKIVTRNPRFWGSFLYKIINNLVNISI